jgi:hypothetical protein
MNHKIVDIIHNQVGIGRIDGSYIYFDYRVCNPYVVISNIMKDIYDNFKIGLNIDQLDPVQDLEGRLIRVTLSDHLFKNGFEKVLGQI